MFTNHLLTALKMYPDYNWNYCYLSQNISITWDIVVANPRQSNANTWSYCWLSQNPNFANPTLPWDYNELSRNPAITWDVIIANPDKPWHYRNIIYAGDG
jgi:hypothetical protein